MCVGAISTVRLIPNIIRWQSGTHFIENPLETFDFAVLCLILVKSVNLGFGLVASTLRTTVVRWTKIIMNARVIFLDVDIEGRIIELSQSVNRDILN